MQKQNPKNYLLKQGTSSEQKERHMQGTDSMHQSNILFFLSPLLINVLLIRDMCSES